MQKNNLLKILFECFKISGIFKNYNNTFSFLFRYSDPLFPYQIIEKPIPLAQKSYNSSNESERSLMSFCFFSDRSNINKLVNGQLQFKYYFTPVSTTTDDDSAIFGRNTYISLFSNTNKSEIIERYTYYFNRYCSSPNCSSLFDSINNEIIENPNEFGELFCDSLKNVVKQTIYPDEITKLSTIIFMIVKERIVYDALLPYINKSWYLLSESNSSNTLSEQTFPSLISTLTRTCFSCIGNPYAIYTLLFVYPTIFTSERKENIFEKYFEYGSLNNIYEIAQNGDCSTELYQLFSSYPTNITNYLSLTKNLPANIRKIFINPENKKTILSKISDYFLAKNNEEYLVSNTDCQLVCNLIMQEFSKKTVPYEIKEYISLEYNKLINKPNTNRKHLAQFISNSSYKIILYTIQIESETGTQWWQNSNIQHDLKKVLSLEEQNFLLKQQQQFESYISPYPIGTIERFNRLNYLANIKENPYAAHELGDAYYTGIQLTYESKPYKKIEIDYKMAYFYYCIAVKSKYYPSCWALADMLLKQTMITSNCHRVAPIYPENEIINLLSIPKSLEYGPALNSLGVLYFDKAKKYKQLYEVAEISSTQKASYHKKVEKYLRLSINHYLDAIDKDNVFASNRLSDLVTRLQTEFVGFEDYSKLYSLYDNDYMKARKKFLEKSCTLGNPWALNKYSLEYLLQLKNGHITQTNKSLIEKGIKYLLIAAGQGFYWAKYNLAMYIYKPCENSNLLQYQSESAYVSFLLSASSQKLACATFQLGIYYKNTNVNKSIEYFQLALQHNESGVDSYKKSLYDSIKTELSYLL